MTLSIVIPNFNGKELLEKNLPYIIAAKQNKRNNIGEIIVVDDASTDDSVKFLTENYKNKIKLFIQGKNQGFATSVNTGVRHTKTDLICLLNTDVVVSKNFLENMNQDFKDPQVFGVSLHEKGYGYAKGKFEKGFIVHQGMPESKKKEESFWASGGSCVLRRDIFNYLGGMDSRILSPFYWEDIDLSYRAQKRGYKILWDPQANVIHDHESTMKKLNQKNLGRIRERNYLLFNWKNLTSGVLIRKHVIFLFKRILSHPGYVRIVLMALKRFGEMRTLRKVEIKEAKVSDEAIFGKFN